MALTLNPAAKVDDGVANVVDICVRSRDLDELPALCNPGVNALRDGATGAVFTHGDRLILPAKVGGPRVGDRDRYLLTRLPWEELLGSYSDENAEDEGKEEEHATQCTTSQLLGGQ